MTSPLSFAARWALGATAMPIRLTPFIDTSIIAAFTAVAQGQGDVTTGRYLWEGPSGVFIGGVGFALYWVMKVFFEAKARNSGAQQQPIVVQAPSNGNGSAQVFAKLQEMYDGQKVASEQLYEAIAEQTRAARELAAAITTHDNYVREHVTERAHLITKQLGEDLAPLMVLAVKSAFGDERVRAASDATTASIPSQRVKKTRKTRS
jgi:hypothetical protein